MEFYYKTDTGISREFNQDAVASKTLSLDLAWSLICDGMGGTKGGGVASALAVDEISNYLNDNLKEDFSAEDIKKLMYNAVENANNKVFEKASRSALLSNMGTTVILCVIKNMKLHIIYAGDSRLYLLSGSEIKQITKDHSVVQEMVDSGELTKEDAKNHPQKNIITKALGVEKEIEPDYIEIDLNPGEIVLLCTDGLTNELTDKEIHYICVNNDVSNVPGKLIRSANIAGGRDNITVSVAKI